MKIIIRYLCIISCGLSIVFWINSQFQPKSVQYFDKNTIKVVRDSLQTNNPLDINHNINLSDNGTRTSKNVTRDASRIRLPRILCWVLCGPQLLDSKVVHVRDTWSRHCDKTLFMSSQENITFPTIGLNTSEGRETISLKTRRAWTYIYHHHLEDADYFVKTDPDTFLIVENLKLYLADRNPEDPEFFGHHFKLPGLVNHKGEPLIYTSGGPGIVLSKKAARLMVEKSFPATDYNCMPDNGLGDYMVARCLYYAGVKLIDTRDPQGKETFIVFDLPTYYLSLPEWYEEYDVNGALKGSMCCSDFPIGLHYVAPSNMHVLYYMFYRIKSHWNNPGTNIKLRFKVMEDQL